MPGLHGCKQPNHDTWDVYLSIANFSGRLIFVKIALSRSLPIHFSLVLATCKTGPKNLSQVGIPLSLCFKVW